MSTNVARASRNLASSFTFNDDGFLPGSNNNANYGSGASVAWADAGETTTSIAAGGLNNTSAYDQSQTWSNSLSASFRAASLLPMRLTVTPVRLQAALDQSLIRHPWRLRSARLSG